MFGGNSEQMISPIKGKLASPFNQRNVSDYKASNRDIQFSEEKSHTVGRVSLPLRDS